MLGIEKFVKEQDGSNYGVDKCVSKSKSNANISTNNSIKNNSNNWVQYGDNNNSDNTKGSSGDKNINNIKDGRRSSGKMKGHQHNENSKRKVNEAGSMIEENAGETLKGSTTNSFNNTKKVSHISYEEMDGSREDADINNNNTGRKELREEEDDDSTENKGGANAPCPPTPKSNNKVTCSSLPVIHKTLEK